MIDDNLLNRVEQVLTSNPQRSITIAEKLGIKNSRRVGFILGILKKQGKAKVVKLNVTLARGYHSSRYAWVKNHE